VWFHFGGSAFEAILKALFPGLRSMRGLTGLALAGDPSEQAIGVITRDTERLNHTLRKFAADIATPMTLGPYHNLLPSDVRTEVCLRLLDSEGFASWLASRDLRKSEQTVEAEGRLRDTFGW
jgi:hypothetical protein